MTTDETRQRWILADVIDERIEQDLKFGVQDLPHGTFRHVFLEEVFEAVAESDPVKLRAELVQAVAVGVKWIEAIDRAAENGG